ncbi:MAG: cytochrome-c peroxidase [Thiohalospira sp.]
MKRITSTLVSGALLGGFAGAAVAQDWPALPDEPPVPEDNPTTEEKVELGKKLYFDPRISETGTVSCNTCHNVMEGGDDGRRTSMGVHGETGPRNAPTVWNAAYLSVQFWDGRADTLEDQAEGPIVNPVEMGMPDHDFTAERISGIDGYRDEFEEVFGDDKIDIKRITKAIGAYERTLVTPDTPYNNYVNGDKDAMSEQELRGRDTFKEVGCTSCHSGPAFAGPQMPLGKGFFQEFPTYEDNEYVEKYDFMEDTGRHEDTGKDDHKHMWRVPTLYNVELTAPYFHNGAVDSLDEAVRVMGKTQLDKELSDQQVDDIVAFLGALTANSFPEQELPRLPSMSGKSSVIEHRP